MKLVRGIGVVGFLIVACGSGGTNPVGNGGFGTAPPSYSGSSVPGVYLPGTNDTVTVLAKLCIEACAHLAAAGCPDRPASTVNGCQARCVATGAKVPAQCADLYAVEMDCLGHIPVFCPASLAEEQCRSQRAAYQNCVAPDAGRDAANLLPECVVEITGCGTVSVNGQSFFADCSILGPIDFGTTCVAVLGCANGCVTDVAVCLPQCA
jgi:hypothetical protein